MPAADRGVRRGGGHGLTSLIAGVAVRPLLRLEDHRGAVLRMLRADDRHFEQFGEIYFSLVNPGAIKAWRRHRRVASFLAVPMGEVRLVLFDDRPGSATAGRVAELQLGRDNYSLVTVPPGVWSGCQALGTSPGLLANCATEPHDPAESETRPPSDPGIPYQWAVA